MGWEDPLEKGKATCSSILAWRIHRVAKSRTRLSASECLSFLPVKTFLFVSQYDRHGTSLVAQRVKNLPVM